MSEQRLGKANKALVAQLTLRTSLQMYAIQSSLKQFPFVFFTRSVTEPAPQYSITSCRETNAMHPYHSTGRAQVQIPCKAPTAPTIKVW